MKIDRLFDVRGRVAFVTGAASGIGLAFAEVMAENGAAVAMVDVDRESLARETARLSAAGCAVTATALDITDDAALQAAMAETCRQHGRLDAVFANAGISAGPGFDLSEQGQVGVLDVEAFKSVVAVNLTANIATMRHAAALMKPQRRGSIVVTTSIAGMRADPLVGYAYAASKSGLNNAVRQAAVELAPHNVRVNAIAPGPFLTNIAGGRMKREPERAKIFAATVPMGRIASTEEIKGLAMLLGSEAGSFLTGAIIPIDGGTTAG